MTADKAPNFRDASEWMEFYEELFEEKEAVTSDPLPVCDKDTLEEKKSFTFRKLTSD